MLRLANLQNNIAVWLAKARFGVARHGEARRSVAWQDKGRFIDVVRRRRSQRPAFIHAAWRGTVWQGGVRLGVVRQDKGLFIYATKKTAKRNLE
jgi:hypothetical protein